MTSVEEFVLAETPEWPLLLGTYARLQSSDTLALHEYDEETAESAPHIRWIPRVSQLPGVEPQMLSKLHGRLIAVGWLRFQLGDSHQGLVYRVSPEGRQALLPANPEAPTSAAFG